jgi:ketosteroid isomerase-like protein
VNAAESAIRSARAASNAAIAARDADLVVTFMLAEVTVAVAGGSTLVGRDASRAAFAEQFADRAFAGYVRETALVVIHHQPTRATEHGQWIGRWRRGLREQLMQGHYEAEWHATDMGWRIASEIYRSSR